MCTSIPLYTSMKSRVKSIPLRRLFYFRLPGVGGLACESCERAAKLEADVKNLIGWQESQNGSIDRVAARVDKLQYWIMGLLGTSVVSLFLLVANLVAKS